MVDGQVKPLRIPVISLLDLNGVHKRQRRRMLSLATDQTGSSMGHPQPAVTHVNLEFERRRVASLGTSTRRVGKHGY